MNYFSPNKRKKSQNKYLNQYNIFLSQKKSKLSKISTSRKDVTSSNKSKESGESIRLLNNNVYTSKIFDYKIKLSFPMIVQYAREKIKKPFMSPYITRLIESNKLNIVKEEEKPILYCLYKINDIFLNKKSRFSVNFYECDIFYNENEYLIKCFKRLEYIIIMRYLLAYIYDKDLYSHYSKQEYKHKNIIVLKKFQYMVNNKYVFDNPDDFEDNINNISEKNKSIFNDIKNSSTNLIQNISPFVLRTKSLLFLYEYEKKNKNKRRDYLFRKTPKYYFVKDVPIEKVPNSIQNFISLGYFMNSLIDNYIFYKKFYAYKNEKPKQIEPKRKINLNNESSENLNIKKQISEDDEDEKKSSSLSESHSEKFLNEIEDESNSNDTVMSKTLISKKYNKRISIVYTKDNKLKKVNIEDNDIIDVERLIKNMENKKEENIYKPRESITSLTKKKYKKKYYFKSKFIGYQIINTDNFELKNLYDENTNFIKKTFTKKFTFQKSLNTKPKLMLDSLYNYSVSFNNKLINNQNFMRSKKYFITSTAINNKKLLDRQNSLNFISNIARKKTRFSSKNNLKKYSQKNTYKYKPKNNYNYNYIFYPHRFKNKGELVKQRKISFSIIHTMHKITFKNTSEFISGIKKTFKRKNQQKELIKEIMTNFGIVYQKRNKSKKYEFITTNNFPELHKNQIKSNSNSKKYKINLTGGSSTKNNFNKKEIYRDYINLNGIFKHKKMNI